MGLIETTDRITRTANMTGQLAAVHAEPSGVGFFLGVQFNVRPIVP